MTNIFSVSRTYVLYRHYMSSIRYCLISKHTLKKKIKKFKNNKDQCKNKIANKKWQYQRTMRIQNEYLLVSLMEI